MRKFLLLISIFLSSICVGQFKVAYLKGVVFDVDAYFMVTKDAKKALQFVHERGDSAITIDFFTENEGALFVGGEAPVLWIPEFPKSIYQMSTLAHEIFHLISEILRRSNIFLTEDTDEVYAYMTSYYTNTIYTLISKLEKTAVK